MVTVSPGKHRRFDAELPPAPDGMPFSSAEYLPSPVDVADPLADANGTWGPGRGGTLTDPDWPPDLGGTGSWLQWDGPAQGYDQGQGGYAPAQGYDAGSGYGPAQGYDTAQSYGTTRGHALAQDYDPEPAYPTRGYPGVRGGRRLYAVLDDTAAGAVQPRGGQMAPYAGEQDSWDQTTAIRQAAEQEAAAIRQQARDEADAIRRAAEQEAAQMRAALVAMSDELSRVAAYVHQNLENPGGLATMPTPASAPSRPVRPATAPVRPAGCLLYTSPSPRDRG